MIAETLIYLPEKEEFLYATEGTGDNLLREDLEAGFKDYVNYGIYRFADGEWDETDGGMILLKEPYAERYPAGKEQQLAIDCVLDYYGSALQIIQLKRRA